MLTLLKYAEIVRNRFRFEIDEKLDVAAFFRDMFRYNLFKQRQFCSNLYRNHVKR